MRLAVVAGSASVALASRIAAMLGVDPEPGWIERFPDGEIGVSVPAVRGADVYLIQSTGPPVHDHIAELLMLADAVRRAGAARVCGVVPYLAYARQDRREVDGGSVGARVVAEQLSRALDHVIAVDLHTPALEGFFSCPVAHLSAVPLLADALRSSVTRRVVVAPDLGAAKRAWSYARLLGLETAGVRKRRLSGTTVQALGVDGDVRDRDILVVDDMIGTGATIEAAWAAVRASGARRGIVAATHGLLVGDAPQRLAALGLDEIVLTDTVAPCAVSAAASRVVSVAPLLADAIGHIHRDAPLAELVAARS